MAKAINILLIGKTGAGKSTLGNALLGYSHRNERYPPFKESANVASETSAMKEVDGCFFGNASRRIKVIDCPGFADSEGRDDQFSPMLSNMMKRIEHVHVLLWCRNGQEDRIDINEKRQLKACREIFGDYLFANMAMNVSKWEHSKKAEKKRKQSEKTLSDFKENILQRLTYLKEFPFDISEGFPIFALDPTYDEDDEDETRKFNETREDMWDCFRDLASKPVFTKEVLEEQRKLRTAVDSALNNSTQEFERKRQEEKRRRDMETAARLRALEEEEAMRRKEEEANRHRQQEQARRDYNARLAEERRRVHEVMDRRRIEEQRERARVERDMENLLDRVRGQVLKLREQTAATSEKNEHMQKAKTVFKRLKVEEPEVKRLKAEEQKIIGARVLVQTGRNKQELKSFKLETVS